MSNVHEIHEAKDYLHSLGGVILQEMGKHKHKLSLETIHALSELACDYNTIADFIRNMCDHHDETLYHREDGVSFRK